MQRIMVSSLRQARFSDLTGARPTVDAIEVDVPDAPASDAAERLFAAADALRHRVECFDFVPSDYRMAWSLLTYLKQTLDSNRQAIAPGEAAASDGQPSPPRLCEWGSGMGVVTGLAAILGYRALGIERDAELAKLSRELLASQGLDVRISNQDMFESRELADVYYAYGWASQRPLIEDLFELTAPTAAFLVLCHGQSDLRVYQKD